MKRANSRVRLKDTATQTRRLLLHLSVKPGVRQLELLTQTLNADPNAPRPGRMHKQGAPLGPALNGRRARAKTGRPRQG